MSKNTLYIHLVTSNKIGSAEQTVPKQLECLRGNVFECGVNGTNGAKIITAQACAAIIEYYAFESKAKSELAKTATSVSSVSSHTFPVTDRVTLLELTPV